MKKKLLYSTLLCIATYAFTNQELEEHTPNKDILEQAQITPTIIPTDIQTPVKVTTPPEIEEAILPLELEQDPTAETITQIPQASALQPANQDSSGRQSYKKKEKKISFNFDNEDLVKIINRYAAKKGINILLPQGALAITSKVTFKYPKKLPLSQAEYYLNLFLDLAGYTMHPSGNFYVITKTDQNAAREPYPLYIGIHPDDLPQGDQRIRAVFYLSNLKVPENIQNSEPLNLILKDMLSNQAQYLFDPRSNGIIITDKANSIASAMKIIVELDTVGTKDVIEIVPLYNSSSKTITELLKSQIIATAQSPQGQKPTFKTDSGLYFAPNTHVASDDRTNSVIIMGRENAVQRLKEFIQEYLDAAPDSGNSILHIYDLQYLDAEAFARVLQGLIESKGIGMQSTRDTGQTKYFDGVKVVAEAFKPSSDKTGSGIGGNRLVIAAPNNIWPQIKTLIEELDKPNLETIIEVLVVDLTLDKSKSIAGQTRLPQTYQNFDEHTGMQAQSAQILGQILDNTTTTPPTTLDADLLRILIGSSTSMATSASSNDNDGSLIIAFNDPRGTGTTDGWVWSVLKILNTQAETNVLSRPFIVALNNTPARVFNKEIRQLSGNQSIGEGGISTIKQKDYEAKLELQVTPRISSADRLNLQIQVDIQEFVSPTNINNATRITRQVKTSANLHTGQILVVGGLRQTRESNGESGVPILKDIPILGRFFSSESKDTIQTDLVIFFKPTIVNAKLHRGLDKFTHDKINDDLNDTEGKTIFDGLKDPITHFFFNDPASSNVTLLKKYLASTQKESTPAPQEDFATIKKLALTTDNPLITTE